MTNRIPLVYIPTAIPFSQMEQEEFEDATQEEKCDLSEDSLKALLVLCKNDREKLMVMAETLIITGFEFTRDEVSAALGINPREYYKIKERFRTRNATKVC